MIYISINNYNYIISKFHVVLKLTSSDFRHYAARAAGGMDDSACPIIGGLLS